MRRIIFLIAAFFVLMQITQAELSAPDTVPPTVPVSYVDIRGEVVDAASQIAPFTWTGQNFAGLHYDTDRNLMSEALTATVTVPDAIDRGNLVYTTYRVGSDYANPEIGEYFEIWWFGEKYMAINGKPYVISPILIEMEENDKKVLMTGEVWYLGNGYSLTAERIDIDANEVWLALNKGGVEVYSSIIRLYDHGDWFNNCMDISGSLGAYTKTTGDVRTARTFVYQTGVGSEADVPIISVYVDAIFRGTTTNLVQLKYAILIDDDLINIIDEGAGILEMRTVTSESVVLDSDRDISLDPDSDFHIAEGLWLHVADDPDGDGVSNCRYYPYIRHGCSDPDPDPTPTPTPAPPPPTPPPVREVEIRGEVAEPTGTQTDSRMWDARNFAAFPYDLDRDVASEILTIAPGTLSGYDRTIEEGNIRYTTTTRDVDFDCSRWGSYRAINFMAEEYFAGYDKTETDSEIIDNADDISLISKGKLLKVLIDEDRRHTISTGASLQLEEGYTLKVVQLDVSGNRAQLELTRNGQSVPGGTMIVDAPDTFVYTKDIGSADDVPIIAVHIRGIYAGTETNMIAIDGIFRISEKYITVKAGENYGEMEITSVSSNRITMKNYDDIRLSEEGNVINLMGRIKLRVADNETLRFAPVVEFTDPGTYEIRGAIRSLNGTQPDEIVWDARNFSAFWYDMDSDAATETLVIVPDTLSGDRTIEEGRLYYATHPVRREYELHEARGLTVAGDAEYMAEGWMGEQYVAVGGRADRLRRLLVEFEYDDKRTLSAGEAWNIGYGFTLTARQIDLEENKVWFSLSRGGRELDEEVISYDPGYDGQDRVYTYTEDIGGASDVPVFSCYVDAIFRGTDSNIVQIKYVVLIDDFPLRIDSGDRFGRMVAVNATSGEVVLMNNETIDLVAGSSVEITDTMYFRVADDPVLRLYPATERTIDSDDAPPNEGEYIFNSELQVNEGITIETSLHIEVVEVKRIPLECAKFRITSYQKPTRTMTVFKEDGPLVNSYSTYSGASIYLDVVGVSGNSVEFKVTGPSNWHVTEYYDVVSEDPVQPIDTDGDGVPNIWDADNSTPEGYWVNRWGVGRMWGDMNGDCVVTSVDALMILQAANAATELGGVFSN